MSQPLVFPSPLAEERRQLKRFVQLVEDMLQSRFYRRLSEMDHTLSLGYSPEGAPQYLAPEYDWDDFRSFLLPFRQIALNESDAVYITRIRNIISKYAAPKYRDDLRAIKRHLVCLFGGSRS